MRDLKADLEICNRATRGPWDIYNINNAEFIAEAREGWPHAIERAIKAEAKLDRLIEGCMRCAGEDDHERFQRLRAEVERLTEINQGCESEAHLYDDLLHRCRTENAKLQLALKKACDMLPACPDELGRLDDMFLRAAERDLRELEG